MQEIFEQALGISSPWKISNIKFNPSQKRLDITIDYNEGSLFFYEDSKEGISGKFKPYDRKEKTWRHLNFFEHECYLTCRVPRIKTDNGKVRLITPPWEGKCPGFTLLFEALLLQLCSEMPANAVSLLTGVDDNKLWRLLEFYVDEKRKTEDFSEVTQFGFDETSKKKRHDYVTLFVDYKTRKTIFVTEGKGSETVAEFVDDLVQHQGKVENITDISSDMSPAFIKGVKDNFPNAQLTFDKFHVIKLINDAVSKVRRAESKENDLLKNTKGIFERNRENMSMTQLKKLESKLELKGLRLKTVRAFHLRESFQEIYKSETKDEFIDKLDKWYKWAIRSKLEPMLKVARTIKKRRGGIENWFESRINNGLLEGINSVIQSAKSKARGFKTFKNFKIIIYLLTANLDFSKVNNAYKELR
jgi:transposase